MITGLFILELFPCSGGMAEGLRRAGLTPTVAFDYDEDACASYTRNLGHAPVRIDVRDLLGMARDGWTPGRPIDLLVADPPCTPWSRAGKRLGVEDDLDMVEDTVELVRLLRPRAYLIANVPGLDDGPNWHVVQRTIGGLAREGYCVKAAAILQGFPPGWVFHGATKKSRWSQIGMAMPPPLAEAVGRSIVRAMATEKVGAA